MTAILTPKLTTVSVEPNTIVMNFATWDEWISFLVINNQDDVVRRPTPHAASVGVELKSDDSRFNLVTHPDIFVTLEDDDVESIVRTAKISWSSAGSDRESLVKFAVDISVQAEGVSSGLNMGDVSTRALAYPAPVRPTACLKVTDGYRCVVPASVAVVRGTYLLHV